MIIIRKCGVCKVVLKPENICGDGIYPPDCHVCCEFMCNKCCVKPDSNDPSISYCLKCFSSLPPP